MKRFTLIVLLFIFSMYSQATVTTTVSQSILEVNDIIQFRIKIDAKVSNLNLKPLEKDFKIYNKYGPNISSSYINGVGSTTTEYVLNISPNRSGKIIIPAFTYNGESSAPITLDVRSAHQSNYQDELFFLTAKISDTSVYIDQPLLLELKFYNAIDVQSANLDLPSNMPFNLEQIGDLPTSTEEINSISYQVSTLYYQITPQNAGQFDLGQFKINGQYAINRKNKIFNTESLPIIVNVKPIPAQYPKNKPWLPATNIQLKDNLAPSFNMTNDANLTRVIDIQMSGLTNNYLPKLSIPAISGLKIYSEDEIRSDKIINNQNTGLIQAKWAILPTQNGKVTLPEYSITWWDVNSDQLRVSKINQREINISGVVDQNISNPQSPVIQTEIITKIPNWIWLTHLALIIGWGISFIVMKLKINALKNTTTHDFTNQTSQTSTLSSMSVLDACKKQSMHKLKQALVDFEKQCELKNFDYSIYSQTLAESLSLLDSLLYNQQDNQQKNIQDFDFVKFAKDFKQIKAQTKNSKQPNETLFSLYPSD
ncbi:BatD family protein [Marinicellulosiphila megalodicopiae]|uniref:BatD family protein n=1 Tax=Marinicellulosiphila megalodicopiae TaxID=2724896 RepID=UPI003BB1C3E8